MAKKATAAAVQPAPARPATFDIGELSRKYDLAAWERAGLVALKGWRAGKRVTMDEFSDALDEVRSRRFA